ncbi:MAG: DUF2183 domain-containing protein [Planctomycetales bacterium]|nr:DUF2183 domain-containing protein [Planctomycetales bacterium]
MGMISANSPISDIAEHHRVALYPSFGRLADDGQSWKLNIHGVVLEPREINLRKRILLRLLKRVMNADPSHFDSELFRRRIDCFIQAGGPGCQIAVRIGDRCFLLPKRTKRNGHFSGTLRLSRHDVDRLRADGAVDGNWLQLALIAPGTEERQILGRCLLLEPTGTSVVSDIDDTIKHTDVASRRSLLANTFLHEFRSIDGMSNLYRQWADQGAVFHYVSSSPWQLFDPLSELCETAGFPCGTMHLRMFRLRDHMLRRMLLIRRKGKGAVIRSLFRSFPNRRFVLVGDSGERDPEIYATLARKFPQQIERILIRQLPFRKLDGERMLRLLRRVPTDRWQLFHDPSEIPSDSVAIDSAVPRVLV